MNMPHILPFGSSTPKIDSTAWAASTATLIGAVTLGAHSSVFYGAVLRADEGAIRIGPGSNVQDNVTMHTDPGLELTIGSRVSGGHGAILHGCVIEDDCLIGMGRPSSTVPSSVQDRSSPLAPSCSRTPSYPRRRS